MDERCPERGARGTRCYFRAGHFNSCEFEPGFDPAWWRTNADSSLVCPHRDLSVCPACSTLPGVTEVAGAHFYDPDGSLGEPYPCLGCGGTDMPLHTDYMCPNCHELDDRVDEHGSEFDGLRGSW